MEGEARSRDWHARGPPTFSLEVLVGATGYYAVDTCPDCLLKDESQRSVAVCAEVSDQETQLEGSIELRPLCIPHGIRETSSEECQHIPVSSVHTVA